MNAIVAYDFRLMAFRNLHHLISRHGKSFMTKNPKDKSVLKKAIAISIMTDTNNLAMSVDSIILCRDGESWRKDVHVDVEYKSSRKKKPATYNYQMFADACDEFCVDMLDLLGIHTLQVDGLEADDVLWYLSSTLNKLNKNVVIVSADSDLRQLIRYSNSEKGSTMVYNANGKAKCVVVTTDFIDKQQELDIFNIGTKNPTMEWLNNHDSMRITLPYELLKKILCGDKGDDVPPISTGKANFTKLMFNKMWESGFFKKTVPNNTRDNLMTYIHGLLTDQSVRNELIIGIIKIMGKNPDSVLINNLDKTITRNIDLVWMDGSVYSKYNLKLTFKELVRQIKDIDFKVWHKKKHLFKDRSVFSNTIYDTKVYYDGL